MSSPYAGNPANYPASITRPSDGDGPGIKALDVNAALEGLADRTAYLNSFLAPGFKHPIRTGTVADMQALAAVAEGEVFLAIDAPGFVGDTRKKARLYWWDSQINLTNSVASNYEPIIYQGAASVDFGPGIGKTGAWCMVRDTFTPVLSGSIVGTGNTSISSGAGYTDLQFTGAVNMAANIQVALPGDIIRVRAVLGLLTGNRRGGFRVMYTDNTNHVIPGTSVNVPNANVDPLSAVMVGEYVSGTTWTNGTVKVQGIIDIGAGAGNLDVGGECSLFVEVIRP